ncbi:RidA family protein [Pseudonocardia kujensis]|nr:RidA family protein [Pseudonocardia kujensis]
MVGDGAVTQAEQALANPKRALGAYSNRPERVLKVNVYLTDIEDRRRINPARHAFWGNAYPASPLVQVGASAHPKAAVEIELMAAVQA